MTRALVVVEAQQTVHQLLELASDFARGSGSELILFHVTSAFEGGNTRDRMQEIAGKDEPYRTGIEGAGQFARDLAESVLKDDIDFEVDGAFGEKHEQIVAAAERHDCAHVFLIGRRRSPTGKAIFGDAAQHVVLNVEVPVTLVMD